MEKVERVNLEVTAQRVNATENRLDILMDYLLDIAGEVERCRKTKDMDDVQIIAYTVDREIFKLVTVTDDILSSVREIRSDLQEYGD